MTVQSKVRKQLADSSGTDVEKAIALALAKQLDAGEGGAIQNWLMLALEPFAAVMNLAEIDAVLQKVGEGGP